MKLFFSKKSRLVIFTAILIAVLALAIPALAENMSATTLRLAKTEGTVDLSNKNGSSMSILQGMQLHSGNTLKTHENSYAYFNLDDTKALKMDEVSNAEVVQQGNFYEVMLKSGELIFDVSQPLNDGETFNIRTSTMVTGIRGTCAIVRVVDDFTTELILLEGKLSVTAVDPITGIEREYELTAPVKATISVWKDPGASSDRVEIDFSDVTRDDLPQFAVDFIRDNEDLMRRILEITGIDLRITSGGGSGGSPATPTPVPAPQPASPGDLPTPVPPPPPEPTPEPTPAPTPTPEPTPEPTPTPTNSPEPTPTATGSPEPTPTGSSSPEPTPTDTPEPSPSPTETATPSPSPTPTPTPIPPPPPTPTPAPADAYVIENDFTDTGGGVYQDTEGKLAAAFAIHNTVSISGAGTLVMDPDYALPAGKTLNINSGNANFGGAVNISGTLNNSGTLNFTGTLDAAGSLTNNGSLTVSGGTTVGGTLTNSGTANFAGLVVNNAFTNDGNATATGNTTVNGTFTNNGTANLQFVSNNSGNTISCGGNSSTTIAVYMSNSSGKLTASPGASLAFGDIDNSGNITIDNASQVSVSASLINRNGAVISISATTITCQPGISNSGTATFSGALNSSAAIASSGSITFNGTVTCTAITNDSGSMTFNNSVTCTNVEANGGTVNFNGALTTGMRQDGNAIKVANGASLNANTGSSVSLGGNLTNEGTVNITASGLTFTNNAQNEVRNGSAVGSSAGITFNCDVSCGLVWNFGNITATNISQFNVSGNIINQGLNAVVDIQATSITITGSISDSGSATFTGTLDCADITMNGVTNFNGPVTCRAITSYSAANFFGTVNCESIASDGTFGTAMFFGTVDCTSSITASGTGTAATFESATCQNVVVDSGEISIVNASFESVSIDQFGTLTLPNNTAQLTTNNTIVCDGSFIMSDHAKLFSSFNGDVFTSPNTTGRLTLNGPDIIIKHNESASIGNITCSDTLRTYKYKSGGTTSQITGTSFMKILAALGNTATFVFDGSVGIDEDLTIPPGADVIFELSNAPGKRAMVLNATPPTTCQIVNNGKLTINSANTINGPPVIMAGNVAIQNQDTLILNGPLYFIVPLSGTVAIINDGGNVTANDEITSDEVSFISLSGRGAILDGDFTLSVTGLGKSAILVSGVDVIISSKVFVNSTLLNGPCIDVLSGSVTVTGSVSNAQFVNTLKVSNGTATLTGTGSLVNDFITSVPVLVTGGTFNAVGGVIGSSQTGNGIELRDSAILNCGACQIKCMFNAVILANGFSGSVNIEEGYLNGGTLKGGAGVFSNNGVNVTDPDQPWLNLPAGDDDPLDWEIVNIPPWELKRK